MSGRTEGGKQGKENKEGEKEDSWSDLVSSRGLPGKQLKQTALRLHTLF
jgi:hypothetical protein